ncbi:MAG: hypothetical protein PHN56_06310 [Candidatus Nanoarchaeia archaeon]|nr:hypothetical protein [Candidatus Nanoarchaeia archaeon]
MKKEKIIRDLLNKELSKKFRDTINSSPIFYSAEELKAKWNLICAVMDRIDSCVNYLNKIDKEYPESEEEFIDFITFSCMIKDAIIRLFEELDIIYPFDSGKNSVKFFKNIYKDNLYPKNNSIYLAKDNPPSDDKFFEYFRALIFAHPFKTNRHSKNNLMKKGEAQYSPWVIVNKFLSSLTSNTKDAVGVRIYSNMFDEMLDLKLSFQLIKDYIISRYELLNYATKWVKDKISEYQIKWSKIKVNRVQEPIKILKEIVNILDERFIDHYEIDDAIRYSNYKLTNDKNIEAVKKYRDNLINKIDNLCNAIDSMDYECEDIGEFYEALNGRPKQTYNMFNYHMEKIFCYLNIKDEKYRKDLSSDFGWGIEQVKLFANNFAKNYVEIDSDTMSVDEIHLLVRTACYLEKIKQAKDDCNINKINNDNILKPINIIDD